MRCTLIAAAVLAVAGVADAGEFTLLGKNDRGFSEFRRERDGAVMVLVPGGPFTKRTYSRDILSDGKPRKLEVPAFLIDRHEVTNAQVAAFLASGKDFVRKDGLVLDAEGRALATDHRWGLSITKDAVRPQKGFERHPAVGTTGWLAIAYAAWVGGDLPRAYEFEKAAAGPGGLTFPWGDDRPDETTANMLFTGPRRTMPVESHPAGRSPYGIYGMAGNVYDRAYWFESKEQVRAEAQPTMLKGGAWVSPHWSNLRCVDRCAQPMAAAEGSVGFRVLIRDTKVVAKLTAAVRPKLRILDDTEGAFAEAKARNVPIFLFLAYDTCGQCDRTRAQVFLDPGFVEYANEHVVVLAGHNPGDAWQDPIEPAEGPSLLYPGCRAEKLAEVFAEFCRTQDGTKVPDAIASFRISPGMFAITPHRDRVKEPEDLILVPESAFPKGGYAPETFIARLKDAQAALGKGIPRSAWKK